MLNPDQLKGIIRLLSDSLSVDQNSKYFEFDIESLSNKKLRELDKYVKQSLKQKMPPIKNQNNNNNNNQRISKIKDEQDKITQLKVIFENLYRTT